MQYEHNSSQLDVCSRFYLNSEKYCVSYRTHAVTKEQDSQFICLYVYLCCIQIAVQRYSYSCMTNNNKTRQQVNALNASYVSRDLEFPIKTNLEIPNILSI